jgi:uncharacterized protein YyaL (SSP411 family)
VNRVLSHQQAGGFYASQDADISLDDDGDYFTWTLEEARAVLSEDESRVAELYYDIGPRGEMHHNPAKNVLWIARDIAWIAEALGRSAADVQQTLADAKAKMLAAREKRPTPFIDTTLYTSWNAMFVSAFLEAANVLGADFERLGADCREFALRTLDRFLAHGWDDQRGFSHRLGGERLEGTLDDQVFMAAALLDAFESTLDARYFEAAERAAKFVIEKYGDFEGGGFFDRASDAAPMGGLEIRRKPLQDSPVPGGNSVAAIVLDRLYGYTGNPVYRERAEATLAAFAGVASEYGLFAATYGLASVLHARHPIQIVVTGASTDDLAIQLERAARMFYRFGKAVLRLSPDSATATVNALPEMLRSTLSPLQLERAQALVCAGGTCYPPVHDPQKLTELLTQIGGGTGMAAG